MAENNSFFPGISPGSKHVSARYIVNDVDAAVEFYAKPLDLKNRYAPCSGIRSSGKGELAAGIDSRSKFMIWIPQ